MFSQLITNLGELETNGLNISGNIVKATVFCVAGDDLESHNIGGITENSVHLNISADIVMEPEVSWTIWNTMLQSAQYKSTMTLFKNCNGDASVVRGVKCISFFNSLIFFMFASQASHPVLAMISLRVLWHLTLPFT